MNQPWALASSMRLVDHADGALGRGRDDDLGAEEAHQLAPLDAERLCHGHHQRISLGGADHGKADAGIAAGRLDHGLAGLQLAGFFGRLDHAERQAVLHRAKRIEGLDLHKEIDARRRQPVDPDDRRVADGFEDTLVFPSHGAFPNIALLATSNIAAPIVTPSIARRANLDLDAPSAAIVARRRWTADVDRTAANRPGSDIVT